MKTEPVTLGSGSEQPVAATKTVVAKPGGPTFEAEVIEPAKVTAAPEVPVPSVAAKPAKSQRYLVNDGEGHSGLVEASDASSAKYRFMREQKICDRTQTWTVTPQ